MTLPMLLRSPPLTRPLGRRPLVAAASCALGLVAAVIPRDAAADVFRYIDRTGRAHLVDVSAAPRPAARPEQPADAPSPAPTRATTPPALLPMARQPVEADPSLIPHIALFRAAADRYALPLELLLAVARVESGFNSRAVSRKGAQGLMQLVPATAASLGVTDPFDPWQSIDAGAFLLRALVNEYDGELTLALAGYNAGSGAVRRYGGVPPFAETQSYVPTVLHVYHSYLAAGLGRAARAAEPAPSPPPAPAP